MNTGRYSHMHQHVAANPAPIEQQIAVMVSTLERRSRWLAREQAQGRLHPTRVAQEMFRLRSVLHTLNLVRDGALAPAAERTAA